MKSISQGTLELAHQVGQEEHRALEHADQDQVALCVVRADLGAELATRSCRRSEAISVSPIRPLPLLGGGSPIGRPVY